MITTWSPMLSITIYPEHKRANLGYQKQLAEAANFRSTGASYNEYLRFQTQPGHSLDPKAYYNTRRIVRLLPVSRTRQSISLPRKQPTRDLSGELSSRDTRTAREDKCVQALALRYNYHKFTWHTACLGSGVVTSSGEGVLFDPVRDWGKRSIVIHGTRQY